MSFLFCNRFVQLLFLAFSLPLFVGCAQIPKEFRYYPSDEAAKQEHRWPDPPEVARYRYAGELTGEDNFHRPGEKTMNAGLRFLRWIVGLGRLTHNPVVLQRPQAVITGADGRVYVSDVSRHAVYVFDAKKGKLLVWENAGPDLRFQLPIGMALGADGKLLVADAALKFVARLGENGEPLGRIGERELQHPAGVARDPVRGRIYVADRGANAIKVFSDEGELLSILGGYGERKGQFNGPTYLTWHNDHLYVTDTLNSRIQIFSADGSFKSSFGQRGLHLGDLPRPKGVAVGNDGNIYVVESYYDYLLVFNHKGELLLPIGGSGHEVGQFYLPAGVWAGNDNRIYIADTFNGRVMIFEYLGDGDGASSLAESGDTDAARDAIIH